jgi:hypothetical protein
VRARWGWGAGETDDASKTGDKERESRAVWGVASARVTVSVEVDMRAERPVMIVTCWARAVDLETTNNVVFLSEILFKLLINITARVRAILSRLLYLNVLSERKMREDVRYMRTLESLHRTDLQGWTDDSRKAREYLYLSSRTEKRPE